RFAVENGTRYITTPGSDLQFYRASYRAQHYVPLLFKSVLEINGHVGLLDSWGNGSDPPPYENFLAGGARTVRGYRESSLGPTENGIPTGGRFQVAAQNNFIVPTPLESDGKSTRLAIFYDVGNVFAR